MTNEELVTAFYESLRNGDVDTFFGIQSDNVVYNISGHSPISGCYRGKQRMINDVLPLVFPKIDAERFEFSKKWKIICADDTTAVCIMEADGPATNGERYDQRYVHIFRFDGGRIVGVTEFFDTELARRTLFDDVTRDVTPDGPFEF